MGEWRRGAEACTKRATLGVNAIGLAYFDESAQGTQWTSTVVHTLV